MKSVFCSFKIEAALGISLEKVRLAQKKASAFWAKGIEMQQVVDQARQSFRIFFKWLNIEMLKLGEEQIPSSYTKTSQQEIAFLAEFLSSFEQEEKGANTVSASTASGATPKPSLRERADNVSHDKIFSQGAFSHRNLERVGQYLRNAPLDQPFDRASNPWLSLLQKDRDLREECGDHLIVEADPLTSLVQEEKALVAAVGDIFSGMITEVTDKCRVLGEIK